MGWPSTTATMTRAYHRMQFLKPTCLIDAGICWGQCFISMNCGILNGSHWTSSNFQSYNIQSRCFQIEFSYIRKTLLSEKNDATFCFDNFSRPLDPQHERRLARTPTFQHRTNRYHILAKWKQSNPMKEKKRLTGFNMTLMATTRVSCPWSRRWGFKGFKPRCRSSCCLNWLEWWFRGGGFETY